MSGKLQKASPAGPAPGKRVIGRVTLLSQVELHVLALDQDSPENPIEIDIHHDGQFLQRITADSELKMREGKPAGRTGRFSFPESFAGKVDYNRIGVTFAATGKHLVGSPASAPLSDLPADRITYEDITEVDQSDELPPLDRLEVDEGSLTERQALFREQGVLRLQGLIPQAAMDAYSQARTRALGVAGNWKSGTPYMHVPELLSLCCNAGLGAVLEELISEPMGVHLNLTDWRSTERNWHQDDYLNPPRLKSWYVAVWMALDDISEDAGPFEYVPGSHRWPVMRREKVLQTLPQAHRAREDWPSLTQGAVSRACLEEVQRRGAKVERFVARKGEVLIWHSRLIHRGSEPKDPTLLRKALIAHYSSIHRRPGFPPAVQASEGGWYFPIRQPLF
jgi:hypothetical protein